MNRDRAFNLLRLGHQVRAPRTDLVLQLADPELGPEFVDQNHVGWAEHEWQRPDEAEGWELVP